MRNISLNKIQEWTVTTTDSRQHPYHQHLNHFQIVSSTLSQYAYNVTGIVEGSWRDTIPISNENRVTIRFRPKDFSGIFVFHCHVIPHSDKGMMAVAQIIDERGPMGFLTCTSIGCMLGVIGAGCAILVLIAVTVAFITSSVTNRTNVTNQINPINDKEMDLDSLEGRTSEADLSSDSSGSFDLGQS